MHLTSRKTALAGAGRFRFGEGSLFKYSAGISGLGAGEKAMCFESVAGAKNVIAGISDGDVTVSVVKEGAGKTVLTGDLDFTGDLRVEGGELVLQDINNADYRYYRINFLNMVIEKMGLKGIDVFGHKVTSRSMTIPVDGVISRAFEWMEKTLPRLQNSLKVGGRVYFMKGPGVADELAVFHPEDFGYKLLDKHFYTIPNSTQDRALIVLERME